MKRLGIILLAFTLLGGTGTISAKKQQLTLTGKTKTFDLALEDFTKLDISNRIEVELTQGDKYGVRIETDKAAEDYLNFVCEKGKLKINYSNKVSIPDELRTKVFITMPEVEYITLNSGSVLKFTGVFSGLELKIDSYKSVADINVDYVYLKINASNASTITMTGKTAIAYISGNSSSYIRIKDYYETDKLSASAMSSTIFDIDNVSAITASMSCSASSVLTISGEANVSHIKAKSSSKIDAAELKLETAEVMASTSSVVNVNVDSTLVANASNSGRIYVFGEPVSIISITSTSGTVTEKKPL